MANAPAIELDSRPLAWGFPRASSIPASLGTDGWHMGRQMIHAGILDI